MLSEPALVTKEIVALFSPVKFLFIYLQDEMKILGTADQAEHSLFNILDHQDSVPQLPATSSENMRVIIAIVQEHAPSRDGNQFKWNCRVAHEEMNFKIKDDGAGQKKAGKEDPARLWNLCLGDAFPVRTVRNSSR